MSKYLSTPLLLLTGVLLFSLSVNFFSLMVKVITMSLALLLIMFVNKSDIYKVLANWYRFRYLLCSIVLLNLVFMPSNLQVAFDKLLMLLLIITAVNIYLQLQSTDEVVVGVSLLLYPLSKIGIKTDRLAILFGKTLDAVQVFQERSGDLSEKSSGIADKSPVSYLPERLANWILFVENDYSRHSFKD